MSISDMRLKESEIKTITDCINDLDNGKIYLFGSRVDDSQKGGDIDLLIISQKLGYEDRIKIIQRIIQRFYEKLGEQKIHIIIAKDTTNPFVKVVYNKGILL